MKLIRKFLGLPEMPAPRPGVPISSYAMAGYVFTISLDLSLIGPESALAMIRKVAGKVECNELEIVAFTMSAFDQYLFTAYGEALSRDVLRLAAERTSEFFQKKLGKKGSHIDWPALAAELSQNAETYSRRMSAMLQPEDLISICNDAAMRIVNRRDPFVGAAIGVHFTRTDSFAHGFLKLTPLAPLL